MSVQTASPARRLTGGFAIVGIGVVVALVTVLALALVRPVLVAFALGGLVLLIPTLLVRDQRAYWLLLLVLSIPFEIHKRTTEWLVDPRSLLDQYGPPASGTLSVDVFLTDVVLFVMLSSWLARLSLRRDSPYFPKIGYIFVFYLAWAMIVSLIEADSFYLSIFQWFREVLYFLSFIYLVNNVITRSQFRAVVVALFVGLVIASGTVITFFALGIGTETFAFSGLYSNIGKLQALYEASSGEESGTKRSTGIFTHPALAACFLELTLPIVLAHLAAARRRRDRILYAALFASGCVALYLTFSRAGLVGFITGSVVFFAIARWSRLISQRAFAWSVFIFAMAAALSAPLLIISLNSRPEAVSRRWELIEITLDAHWQLLLGAGLNNSSAVIKEGVGQLKDRGQRAPPQGVPTHYLVVLTEVGLVGFLLFFAFFWQIVMVAFRSMRAVETEMKLLLVGIVGGLVSLATQNLADDALGGHSINAMLWLFAGLIVAIARRIQTERALPAPAHGSVVTA